MAIDKSVLQTVQTGLCASCGLCRNVCPKGSIRYVREKGKYQPQIDVDSCVNCGLCAEICPGIEMRFPEKKEPIRSVYGSIWESFNAWSKDPELRHISASGGVVTTLVAGLLKNGMYDAAFCVDSYNYEQQLKTRILLKEDLPESWKESNLPKSRYLPVSHEKAVAYIKTNPEMRVILIGNSCAVQGFRKLISKFKLRPENYLLVGLFCDKVFNYNINDYYQDRFAGEKKLAALQFKNKESGGWPGNMKLMFADGSSEYLDKSERGKMKEYFMPERCLYCVDKLNVCADISLGDNYTGQNNSSLGSNTVLIRTENGKKAWEAVVSALEYEPVDPAKLTQAQYLEGRLNNLQFSALKQRQILKTTGDIICINRGLTPRADFEDFERAWKHALGKLHAGEAYREDPSELDRQQRLSQRRKNSRDPSVLAERIYYAIKRRIR